MASTAEPATFKHDALPDAGTYIRLLEVTSADPTGDISIHCRLTTWPKASAPAYTAISYTWGDANSLGIILVNREKMQVRRNCEDVLRQLCWAKGGHFWIDAICINQADNDEKSVQVAGMGGVYRDARQTLACVGPHADDSEFLFDTLREHRRGYVGLGGDLSDTLKIHEYLSQNLSDESALERVDKALSMFLTRSYFQRVWIYQELFFGHDIKVCCADDYIVELPLLWALYLTVRNWMLSPFQQDNMPKDMSVRQSHYYFDRNKLLLRAAAMEKEPLSLSDMLTVVHLLQCEDPRDRVFGTLTMVDWEGETPIRPDYHMDPFDLAIQILQRIHDNSREYLMWILQDTIRIAHLVGLPYNPSRRLADGILARRSRENMAPRLDAERIGLTLASEPTTFWGYRIYSQNGGWCILSDPSKDVVDEQSALRHENLTSSTSHGHSLTIHKWSKGTAWDEHEIAVLLPEEAEPQDWLLIPQLVFAGYTHTPAALIARDGHDGQPQIVGKALFAASGDWPWKALQVEGSKFGVYLDHEDAIVLAHSCDWNPWGSFPRNAGEPHKFQVDGYFATRLCGERSKTWAKRMDREPH